MITHRLVVGVDSTLDELKDQGVVVGNVSIDKRNPLIDYGVLRGSMTNEGRVRS
jgi:hypothetical protein